MTIADSLIDWIEEHLRYPSGPPAGEPVRLLEHERQFVGQAFAPDCDEAAISMPRGNSKTGLCAMIGAAAICPEGPLLREGSDVAVVAASIKQGRLTGRDILRHARGIDRKWLDRGGPLRKVDTMTQFSIENTDSNATLQVAGNNPDLAHGLRLALALMDEPAKWQRSQGKDRQMYVAISTAMGKIPGARMIALGTRPDTRDHWFEELLAKPSAATLVLAAPPDTPDERIADPEVWLACNPLAKVNETLRKRIESEAANLATPAAIASFKALRLNMGVAEIAAEALVDETEWESLPRDQYRDGGHVLGIDLGSRSALSAAAAAWGGGAVDTLGVLGRGAAALPVEDERLSRSSLPIPSAGEVLDATASRWGEPVAVVADNYRSTELRRECNARGWDLEVRHSPEWSDHAVGTFRASLSELSPADSPLLDWCMAGARVVRSTAGAKLARDREGGRSPDHRDDPIAALLPAVAMRLELLGADDGMALYVV